jgi:hypothetical protein
MRRVEIFVLCAVCAVPAFAQTAAPQNYNGTETFEPGKKYNCLPTPDHKGWDCNEAGKAGEIKPKEMPTPPPAPAPEPTPASSPPPAESAPTPAAQPSSRSTLPSYLTNAAANSPAAVEEAPSTVSAAAAHANAPSPQPETAAPTKLPAAAKLIVTPAPKPAPLKPAAPKPSVTALPPPTRPPAKPPLPPRVTHAPVVAAASGGGEFMTLPGDHFVVEMAHASSRNELDAVKTSTHVPSGELYELHLRQNGADAWLLLWGSFDTLDAARAARNTISASATPGWPRRVAPLQAEARRLSP